MPTELEAVANLTEGEDKWLQLWSWWPWGFCIL